ncbi:hypothetical protein [Allosphingosinicella vermicomposti]|uniref:hypothetical protein n=1 Tax=Allosphingosinicella vermicomposti TaxID=614671 RepID=UPI000D0F5717|nr:hypothetical protein [Allosphingosinicella vermicomposti]
MTAFEELVASVRACRLCEGILPGEPRPVIQISPSARQLIASQAPGTKVHASGIRGSKPICFSNYASACRTFWEEKDERIRN